MNRSIQAEGSFAQVKQNMKFRRFLSQCKKMFYQNTLLCC
ncbi:MULTISPECIES: hypothetical protein [unclassified Clostridioides]